jgi:acetyl-CoA carboxylase/biotin carboxylase 1
MGAPGVVGNKPHQRLARCVNTLEDILDGFDNQAVMVSTLKDLIDVLHEPDLPYSEATAILSSLSGRMPGKLEESIRSAIDAAKAKGPSQEFPAVRIKKVLEHYIQDNVLPQDRTMFRAQLAPVFDVLERFSGGLKGHEQQTISNLLERYDATEKLFGGSIETRILTLRDQHKDDLDKVVGLVLSHIKAQSKAKLVLAILDYVKTSGLNVSHAESRLYTVMQNLAALESKYVRSSGILKHQFTSPQIVDKRIFESSRSSDSWTDAVIRRATHSDGVHSQGRSLEYALRRTRPWT